MENIEESVKAIGIIGMQENTGRDERLEDTVKFMKRESLEKTKQSENQEESGKLERDMEY